MTNQLTADEAAQAVLMEFDDVLHETVTDEYVVNEHILGEIESNDKTYEAVLVLREKA